MSLAASIISSTLNAGTPLLIAAVGIIIHEKSGVLNLGIEGKAGYLLEDNWMVLAQASLKHTGSSDAASSFTAGIGGLYYIVQNGLYLGANLKYLHADHSYNDLMPGAEVGYAFSINRSVTIEPAIYYDHSFNNSDYSTVGLKVGIGIYLFDD